MRKFRIIESRMKRMQALKNLEVTITGSLILKEKSGIIKSGKLSGKGKLSEKKNK